MSIETADHSTAALDRSATRRALSWSVVTIVSIVLGLAAAGIMTAFMFWIGDYYLGPQESQDEVGRRKLQELRAGEQEELETFSWINRPKGVVRLPIDRAMQLVIEEDQSPRSPTTSRDNQPALTN